MTYAVIDLAFLAAAVLIAVGIGRRPRGTRRTQPAQPAQRSWTPRVRSSGPDAVRRPQRGRRARWVAVVAAGAVLAVLTAVFDNVMIGVGLFGYAPEALTGLSVGLAPVEDFAYPVAAAILLPVLWRRLSAEKRPAPDGLAVRRGAAPARERP